MLQPRLLASVSVGEQVELPEDLYLIDPEIGPVKAKLPATAGGRQSLSSSSLKKRNTTQYFVSRQLRRFCMLGDNFCCSV